MDTKKSNIRIRGMEELQRKLRKLGADVSAEMGNALAAGAEIVKNDARMRVPVRTGNLRDSIDMEQVSSNEIHVGPGKEGWYGQFIELGKKGYAAHPFMRPAIDERRSKVVKAVKDRLKKAIARVAR
jgi:HK97 gp10 family phage protein